MLEFKGIQKTTLLDYPGEVAATFFLGGCNFRCPYCYNSDLALDRDTGISISEEEALDFLSQRKDFLDGVCFTGGEPLLHMELAPFLKKVKELNYRIKLDTNGSYPDVLRRMIESDLLDYVAMDIKAPPGKYGEVAGAGVEVDKIKESVQLLKDSNLLYEFRTTVFSGLTLKDFLEIAEWLSPAKKYCLQAAKLDLPLLDDKFREKYQPPAPEYLSEILKQVKPYFEKVEIRA